MGPLIHRPVSGMVMPDDGRKLWMKEDQFHISLYPWERQY